MKNWKPLALLNTPLGVVFVVGMAVLGIEFLLMAWLLEALFKLHFRLPHAAMDIIDAVTLTAIISPVLYFLVFRKMQMYQQRLQQINASTQDAIIVIDEQGRISEWNLAAQKMCQYSREEALGQQMQQLIAPSCHYADIMRSFFVFMKTGEKQVLDKIIETPVFRKDGSEFTAELSLSSVKSKNHWHAVGIMRDITERKRTELALQCSEDNLNRAQAVAQVGSWNLDIASGRIEWSKEAHRLFGIPEGRVIDLENFTSTIYPDDREGVLNAWNEAVAGAPYDIEHRIVADGEIRWVRERAIVERDAESRVISGIGTTQDITGRKQAEAKILETQTELQELLAAANQSRQIMLGVIEDQQRAEASLHQLNEELENKVKARTADLEQARLDAEQANSAKSAFLAAMSHEIRTPMNGVIGMVDVLQQSSLNGAQVEMVDLIRESAYSLLGIINDILDFSKAEAGRTEIEYAPMLVEDTMNNVCGMLANLARKNNVEFTLFTDPAIPEGVIGDQSRLRQVLINLANNALKFSSGQDRPGHVSVRAELVELEPEQAIVEFQIADNGIGMDSETLSRLFTPFTQADSTTTRRFGGTGLGLVISRQLVELMGGEITVQSELDKGSLFTARLPFTLAPEKSTCCATPSGVAGLSCLMVGDQDELIGDLARYLVSGGASVERVASLAAAKALLPILPGGKWILIIDAIDAVPSLDELRVVASNRPEHDSQFIVVLRRGSRHLPRVEDNHLLVVDGNILTRYEFLKGVAIAAGRVPMEKATSLIVEKKPEHIAPSREHALQQGRLILVAEDNEINQKVIQHQLALFGLFADMADNGQAALTLWQSSDYVLLLSDLNMPIMDGYELTAAIRAAEQGSSRHTPIVALTANAIKSEVEHCYNIGMDDYLSKPAQLADLQAILEKWLPVAGEAASSELPSAQEDLSDPQNPAHAASLPVDVNVLKALVGDDEAILREFFHDFRISAQKIAAKLNAACVSGQTEMVGALAHKLKSSARSVGALALGELCAEMEQAGYAGNIETLTALLHCFEQENASVASYLDGY